MRPKGEVLAWGVFGGISFVGWLVSFGIRGESLESGDWDESSSQDGDEEEGDYDDDGGVGQR